MNKFVYFAILLLALVAAPVTTGCGATTSEVVIHNAISVSNTSVLTIETAQDVAVALYREEQMQALQAAVSSGASKEAATAKVQEVREKWKPAWTVFEKARASHATLASLLAAGDAANQKDVAKAVADLLQALNDIQGVLAGARVRVYAREAL